MISPVSIFPCNTGGMVRIKNLLQGLSKDHQVDFFSPVEQKTDNNIQYIQNKNVKIFEFPKKYYRYFPLVGNNPYHVNYYYSNNLNNAIKKSNINEYDLIYLHFIYSLIYLPQYITIPVILDQQNVDHIIWYRKRSNCKNLLKKFVIHQNLQKTIEYEKKYLRRVSSIVSVSKLDRERTEEFLNYIIPSFIIAPNGVDIEKYIPRPPKKIINEITVGYLGSYDIEINQQAAFILVNKIIPELRELFPGFKISGMLVGRNPTKKLLNLAKIDPLITFTGTVDDISRFLNVIDIFVAPIVGGGGTKLKLFEAMASGIPTVGTKYLYEGVDDIENGKHALIAENEEDIPSKVEMLINNQELYRGVAKQARDLIERYYSWEEITKNLSKELENLINDP